MEEGLAILATSALGDSKNVGIVTSVECLTIPEPPEIEEVQPGNFTDAKRQNKFFNYIYEILSAEFPAAGNYLLQRFAFSVDARRARLMYWRDQYLEREFDKRDMQRCGPRESHLYKPPTPDTLCTLPSCCMKWNTFDDIPKPATQDSASQGICVICFESIPSEECRGDSWREHAIQDLRPYMCLAESCQDAHATLNSFDDWIEHLKKDVKDTADPPQSCPICSAPLGTSDTESTSERSPYEHIAGHLYSLALSSLPLISSYSGIESERSRASIVTARHYPGAPGVVPILQGPEHLVPAPNERPILNSSAHAPPYIHRIDEAGFIGRNLFENRPAYQTTHIPDAWGSIPRSFDSAAHSAVSTFIQPRDQTQKLETFDILAAEDNRVNQAILRKYLKKYQHTVVMANNGQEALDIFQRRSFDIVLMDISMPVMDGFMATEKIREYEQLHGLVRTPIIAMCVHGVRSNDKDISLIHMDDFIMKPLKFGSLNDKILQYGRMRRAAVMNHRHQLLSSVSAGRGMNQQPRCRAKI